MKKRIGLIVIIAVIISVSIYFHIIKENPFPYKGEYKELYTAAVYSIPDSEGYMFHGEAAYDSDIYIWEQDEYGRTLFSYCEDYQNEVFALIICQSYDEKNVLFYPDANYVLTKVYSRYAYDITDEDHLMRMTEELYLNHKDDLKAVNDWNKPIDKTKCVSYPITDHKSFPKNTYSLSVKKCNEILKVCSDTLYLSKPESAPHRYNNILQTDKNGLVLHEIYGVHADSKYYIKLFVITDKNGNYNKEHGIHIVVSSHDSDRISDIYNVDDITEFKKKNGWEYNFSEITE